MSAGGGGEDGQDFDLNLAPIIDCFTVLITYLLVSASFLSLTMLEVGVAAVGSGAGTPATAPKEPPLSLTVQLAGSREISLKLTGGKEQMNQTFKVAPLGVSWDFKALRSKLDELKQKWPAIPDATVSADAMVPYKDLVKFVEVTRVVIPKIYLSGQ